MTRSLLESLGGGSPVAWARDFLGRAGFPVTPANVQTVFSWELAESGAGGGMWNPLNTTQGGYAGESNANGVGVKNYRRRDDGLDANARVIHNGFYPLVVAAFERGTDAGATVRAIVSSPWGTRAIRLVAVPGGTTAPIPAPLTQEEPMPVRTFGALDNPDPNVFAGAVCDVQAGTIALVDAVLEPAEDHGNPHPWWSVESFPPLGPGGFVVTKSDRRQYHYASRYRKGAH